MEDHLQAVIEAASSALVLVDRDGRIELVNAELETLFRYKREDLVGQPLEVLVPEVHARHSHLWPSFFANLQPLRLGEMIAVRGDATEFPVEIRLKPLEVQDGVWAAGTVVDLTGQKRLAELEFFGCRLALGSLVSGHLHEMNGPLYRLMTWANALVAVGDDPDKRKECMDELQAAASTVSTNTDKLRRIINGSMYDVERVDLNEAIESTLELQEGELQKVTVTTELANDLPRIFANRLSLQILIANLVRNAAQSGQQVAICTFREDDQVAFVVTDDGSGFDVPATQLFDINYTTKELGVGLGLHTCRSIVESRGGKIRPSCDKHGTCFKVTLPLGEKATVPSEGTLKE